MKELKNKIILITGAAGGIGLQTSSYFAEPGNTLILTDINEQSLQEAKKRLSKYPSEIIIYTVDQTDKKAVDRMAKDVLKKYGTPDILINNAGIGYTGELADTSLETWHKLMNVNFWGALHFVYAFLPAMKEKNSGHIVNVATGQVFYKIPTWGAYTVSKTALASFTDILRAETEKYNILVTTVYPYMVNTGFYKDAEPETVIGKLSMSLLPLYSQSPQTVAKIIYEAVRNNKAVEMVSPLNYIGKYWRFLAPANGLLEKLVVSGLTKNKNPSLTESKPAKVLSSAINNITGSVMKLFPKSGFKFDEVMSGEYEFMPGYGEAGKRPMEFRVSWGPDNFREWLNPAGDKFLRSELSGTVSISGLCENAHCSGYLEFRYLRSQKITYYFTFEAGGKTYEYKGEKKQIYPWNLAYSHSTCFGELREKGKPELISRSITHFHWDSMPEFMKSLHLVS